MSYWRKVCDWQRAAEAPLLNTGAYALGNRANVGCEIWSLLEACGRNIAGRAEVPGGRKICARKRAAEAPLLDTGAYALAGKPESCRVDVTCDDNTSSMTRRAKIILILVAGSLVGCLVIALSWPGSRAWDRICWAWEDCSRKKS